jgi:hypothetical protein
MFGTAFRHHKLAKKLSLLRLVCRKENVLDIGSDRKAYLEKEGLLGGQLVLFGRRVSLPNFFRGFYSNTTFII